MVLNPPMDFLKVHFLKIFRFLKLEEIKFQKENKEKRKEKTFRNIS